MKTNSHLVKVLLGMQTSLPLLALLASYMGHVHPLGDSLAVFPQYLIILTAGSIFLMVYIERRYLAMFSLTLVLMASTPFLTELFTFERLKESEFVIYQKNMSVDLSEENAFIQDFRSVKPDFAAFQEASGKNREIISGFEDILPYSHFCNASKWQGEAVASRWPIVRGTAKCVDQLRMALMQVETPKGRVWLVSMHQRWPWPSTQATEKQRFLDIIKGLEGEVIIAGDFNMVPWSHTLHEYELAANARLIPGFRGSYPLTWDVFWIPIDHVLLGNSFRGTAEMRDFFGSDHRGIVGRFNIMGDAWVHDSSTPAGSSG